MPQLRPRPPKADSVKGESPSPDHESSDEEQAHSRPRIRQSKSHASQARQDSAPEADTPTTSPMPKTDDSTSTKPYSHLLGFMVRKITKKHEKPIRDEYDEELRSLGERRKDANPGQAGAMVCTLSERVFPIPEHFWGLQAPCRAQKAIKYSFGLSHCSALYLEEATLTPKTL